MRDVRRLHRLQLPDSKPRPVGLGRSFLRYKRFLPSGLIFQVEREVDGLGVAGHVACGTITRAICSGACGRGDIDGEFAQSKGRMRGNGAFGRQQNAMTGSLSRNVQTRPAAREWGSRVTAKVVAPLAVARGGAWSPQ